MAQNILFTVLGAIRVEKDTKYTPANVPGETTAVRVSRGVRITDEFGQKTRIRGLKVVIAVTEVTAPDVPLPNVATIMHEGEIEKFSPDGTYTFLDSGIIEYGIYTAI